MKHSQPVLKGIQREDWLTLLQLERARRARMLTVDGLTRKQRQELRSERHSLAMSIKELSDEEAA